MTDSDLILKWNDLKNRLYDGEELTSEELHNFNTLVQESYNNNEISKHQLIKYAELFCYLSKQ